MQLPLSCYCQLLIFYSSLVNHHILKALKSVVPFINQEKVLIVIAAFVPNYSVLCQTHRDFDSGELMSLCVDNALELTFSSTANERPFKLHSF